MDEGDGGERESPPPPSPLAPLWSAVQTQLKNEGLTKSGPERGQVNWANLQG